MADEQLTYIGKQAAEMIASGVKQAIDEQSIDYNLDDTGHGLDIGGGFATDSPSIPIEQVFHVYSTEEKVIGKWIDGKPIYEKTIYGNGHVSSVSHGIENLEYVIDLSGCAKYSDGNGYFRPIVFTYSVNSSSDNRWYSGVALTNIDLIFQCGSMIIDFMQNWSVTIQYTKTTD